jgi:predicted XRE-type DNA-binding protein
MAKLGSPPVTRELPAHIKFLLKRGDLFQQQIAALLGINQGRISDVKHGRRHPDVLPAKGPFPA